VVIADVVEDIFTIYERKFKYKALTVEPRIEPGLRLCTLPGELKQILSNLVANAIDASEDGGKIFMAAHSSRDVQTGCDGARIILADNGIGIADDDKRRLFTPFFTTKKEVGTGLGLWITRDLIEKKGGRIRLRSRRTKPSGTVINIFLPLTVPDKSAELVVRS
jgi:signal transduction histidine kinase